MNEERSYSIFADESSLGDRYLAFGAILLPTTHVAECERRLEEYCQRRGFAGREMSWKKCSSSKASRYREFIDMFWTLGQEFGPIDLRAMVVDQWNYPLKAPEWGCTTEEEGFYKFYYYFLTRSVMIVAPKASQFRVHVAATTDRYPYRTEILEKTVGGTLGRTRGRSWELVDVIRDEPKKYRLHQLADVMLGAVTHRLNDRTTGQHKEDLARFVERRVGRKLDFDWRPWERPFNTWFFARKGDRRWAKGSQGQV